MKEGKGKGKRNGRKMGGGREGGGRGASIRGCLVDAHGVHKQLLAAPRVLAKQGLPVERKPLVLRPKVALITGHDHVSGALWDVPLWYLSAPADFPVPLPKQPHGARWRGHHIRASGVVVNTISGNGGKNLHLHWTRSRGLPRFVSCAYRHHARRGFSWFLFERLRRPERTRPASALLGLRHKGFLWSWRRCHWLCSHRCHGGSLGWHDENASLGLGEKTSVAKKFRTAGKNREWVWFQVLVSVSHGCSHVLKYGTYTQTTYHTLNTPVTLAPRE
jgi:hypothetical protein